jgi:hypothetical protein
LRRRVRVTYTRLTTGPAKRARCLEGRT